MLVTNFKVLHVAGMIKKWGFFSVQLQQALVLIKQVIDTLNVFQVNYIDNIKRALQSNIARSHAVVFVVNFTCISLIAFWFS